MTKRNGTWKIVGIILVVVGLLAGGAAAYASAISRIAILETEQKYTREDIKEIKVDVKEILRTVKKE